MDGLKQNQPPVPISKECVWKPAKEDAPNNPKHNEHKTMCYDNSKEINEIKEETQNNPLDTPSSPEEGLQHDDGDEASSDHSDPHIDQQMDSSQKILCSVCGLEFSSYKKRTHHKLVTHTEPQYKCSKCPKAYHYQCRLTRHESTHQEKKCKICFEVYRTEYRYGLHRRTSHSFPCDLCKLKFTTNIKLNCHMRNVHQWEMSENYTVVSKVSSDNPQKTQLQDAIDAIITQRLLFAQATDEYNIPKQTLYDTILGKKHRMDILKELVLSPEEEAMILDFCCDPIALPYKKLTNKSLSSILEFMTQFQSFRDKGDEFKFGGRFAYRWWWAFCRKHSVISMYQRKTC